MKTTSSRSFLLFATLAVVAVPASGQGAPSAEPKPFPYDPVCSWGRIANGKGFLIRCLSEAEAASLGVPGAAAPPTRKEAGAPGSAQTGSEGAAGDEGKGEVGGDEEPGDSVENVPAQKIDVALGPVVADTGSLPKAVASLSKANDRYLECIEKNGGMFRDEGELHVRFLVRGRGRAEGATVEKRRSITEKAGKCIADVVDRRFVGYPDAEMVGATLVMKFKKSER